MPVTTVTVHQDVYGCAHMIVCSTLYELTTLDGDGLTSGVIRPDRVETMIFPL